MTELAYAGALMLGERLANVVLLAALAFLLVWANALLLGLVLTSGRR